jgi:glucose-1-phosphate cytidylyltransferase
MGSRKAVEVHGAGDGNDWDVTLADTGLHTMTGGRIKRIERYIDGDDFLATYGDGLSNVNIRELIDFHRRTGKIATVTGLHPFSRFGVLDVDSDSVVTRFREKPQLDGMISGGFFVFNRRIFDYLDEHCVLEQEPMRRLAEDGEMALFKHEGYWKCMDTYRDFVDFNEAWDSGATPWKVW